MAVQGLAYSFIPDFSSANNAVDAEVVEVVEDVEGAVAGKPAKGIGLNLLITS